MFCAIDGDIISIPLGQAKLVNELKDIAEGITATEMSDELNAVYVAFTRAAERMHIQILGDGTTDPIANALMNLSTGEQQGEEMKFHIGERERSKDSLKVGTEKSLFSPKNLDKFLWFPDIALKKGNDLEAEVYF